jgi:hypothetical protein
MMITSLHHLPLPIIHAHLPQAARAVAHLPQSAAFEPTLLLPRMTLTLIRTLTPKRTLIPRRTRGRRYQVDGHSCECRREALNSRCYCDADDSTPEKRAAVEKQALRMHRRTLYKRVDACDWATAPAMEVSYYTIDAKCAPNAKNLMPDSDTFELGWDVKCGVVQGDGEYKIKMMDCNMYGA